MCWNRIQSLIRAFEIGKQICVLIIICKLIFVEFSCKHVFNSFVQIIFIKIDNIFFITILKKLEYLLSTIYIYNDYMILNR